MKKKNILVVGKQSKIAQIFLKEKIEHATVMATDRSSLDLMSAASIDLFIKQNRHISFDAVIFFCERI